MPTYEYKCTACKHLFEHYQSMSDKHLKKCPACGKNALERLIGTGAAIIFKGSGFYQTDYRSESYKKAADADSKSSKPETAAASDSKTTTPAAPAAAGATPATTTPAAAPASSAPSAESNRTASKSAARRSSTPKAKSKPAKKK